MNLSVGVRINFSRGMAESFWASNPCVPSWSDRVTSWWNTESIRLLRTEPGWTVTAVPVLGYTLRRAVPTDALPLTEFWGRYYSSSRRCMCAVPVQMIQENIRSNRWEVYVVIQNTTGTLVGSVVRHWFSTPLHIKQSVFPRAAMIEYFCTAPGVRKRGIGRWLLATLQNTGPVPLPPHLILWEGVQVRVPPTVAGLYWNRRVAIKGQERGIATQIQGEEAKRTWDLLKQDRDIYTEWSGTTSEVTLWKTALGSVAIWNTFHWHLPEGQLIGVVLCATSPSAVNACAEAKGIPFGILVAPGEYADGDAWSYDSPFQWMTYNLLTPFCSSQCPMLAL